MKKPIEVIKTYPTDKDFHLFTEVAKTLYPPDSIRHKESEHINLAILHSCYVVLVAGKPSGRAALYMQDKLSYGVHNPWMIGNYECVDENEAAKSLLEKVCWDVRQQGGTYLIGPMNGSTWDNYRFSVSHREPPFLLEPYHYLYYNEQFMINGFEVIKRYNSNKDDQLMCDGSTLLAKEREFSQQGVTIRGIDINRIDEELNNLHAFIGHAFQHNFLYTPIDLDRFISKYRAALPMINPEYVLLAENRNGEVVGFIFSYDDAYAQGDKKLIIKTLARHEDKAYAGLGHVLVNRVTRLAKGTGYQSIIHAFIINEGDATTVSRNFRSETYKEYVLYGMSIDPRA
ncbi:hypothetical protein [Parapedobacter tibetensis]|uniref:hypothetical protein n=1 Tax=Parapedobacter tibetensis TaxID=2972951 RepID=UPI00214DDFC0|nr:hypothetical protein [Parapedobacter tibetensis]